MSGAQQQSKGLTGLGALLLQLELLLVGGLAELRDEVHRLARLSVIHGAASSAASDCDLCLERQYLGLQLADLVLGRLQQHLELGHSARLVHARLVLDTLGASTEAHRGHSLHGVV